MTRRFRLALAGGTFDRLHRGHEAFLSAAFRTADRLVIGIASDGLARRKEYPPVEPLRVRRTSLLGFLKKKGWLSRARIATLYDVYGPLALSDKPQAVIATRETALGARLINAARKKSGKKPLAIVSIPLIFAKDGDTISSTRIRAGEISRTGKPHLPGGRLGVLAMPSSEARILRIPLGKLFGSKSGQRDNAKDAVAYSKKKGATLLATVGDACFLDFHSLKIKPAIAVVDGKIKREFVGIPNGISRNRFEARNLAGTVTPKAIRACKQAVRAVAKGKRASIVIDGEEDLVGIPLLLALPLGAALFYGMPDRGIVCVIVDEAVKEKAFRILSSFRQKGKVGKHAKRLFF